LELAAEAPKLRCFTYVSTAYCNSHLAKGETVKEVLYPDAITRATGIELTDADRARVLTLLMNTEKRKADVQVHIPVFFNVNIWPRVRRVAGQVCMLLYGLHKPWMSARPRGHDQKVITFEEFSRFRLRG
jgi:hypothetical protein